MNYKKSIYAIFLVVFLSGCAAWTLEPEQISYGEIISLNRRIEIEEEPNYGGALVGSAAGAVAGNQFGKGKGKKAMTFLGAIAGAMAGSQVGTKQTAKTVVEMAVKTQDGNIVYFETPDAGYRTGQKIRILQRGRKTILTPID